MLESKILRSLLFSNKSVYKLQALKNKRDMLLIQDNPFFEKSNEVRSNIGFTIS